MSDIEIHHLGAAYALDALDDRERAAYEAHFATCAVARKRTARSAALTCASTAPRQPNWPY